MWNARSKDDDKQWRRLVDVCFEKSTRSFVIGTTTETNKWVLKGKKEITTQKIPNTQELNHISKYTEYLHEKNGMKYKITGDLMMISTELNELTQKILLGNLLIVSILNTNQQIEYTKWYYYSYK